MSKQTSRMKEITEMRKGEKKNQLIEMQNKDSKFLVNGINFAWNRGT